MRAFISILALFILFTLKANGAEDAGSVILSRDLEKLRELVKENPGIGGDFGVLPMAPIHQAAVNGWKEGIEVLLGGKVDPNILSKTGETALHFACSEGNSDLIEVLVSHGARIDGRNSLEMTPLHMAAKYGRLGAVETLLRLKADPNARDKEYRTPLHWAARFGKDVEEESSNFSLDRTQFRKCAEVLLENGAQVNSLDDLDMSPLANARKFSGHSMSFDSLYGVLSKAGGKEESAEILGKDAIDLFNAIEKGDLKTFSGILEKSPALAFVRKGGTTPLHKAAWENRKEMVEFLLGKGLDIDSKKRGGSTALHEAAFRGHLGIARFLLERGAKIQGFDPDATPLHSATTMNQTEVIGLLLEKGADPNSSSEGGQGPLFVAAREGRVEAAQLLLAHGADMNRKDRNGFTPLSIARDFSQEEIVTLFESRGATK